MKKIFTIVLLLSLAICLLSCGAKQTKTSPASGQPTASAPSQTTYTPPLDPSVTVFVTIVDENGRVALAQECVNVEDADGDGKFTILDAFTAAHDLKFEGGAEAGFLAESSDYGLSIVRLWGSQTSTAFSYYVNAGMSGGLYDELQDGDYLDAYAYTDCVWYSDHYSCFDKRTVSAAAGEEITLKMSYTYFDASYALVTAPAPKGVSVLANGNPVGTVNGEGEVTLSFEEAGTYTITTNSAGLEGYNLVSATCIITVG